jgi:hypothetical protein
MPLGSNLQRSEWAAITEFKRLAPCPSTSERRGKCPGYQIDHIQPLCAGGPDSHSNMQWLSVGEHKKKTARDVRYCRTK